MYSNNEIIFLKKWIKSYLCHKIFNLKLNTNFLTRSHPDIIHNIYIISMWDIIYFLCIS